MRAHDVALALRGPDHNGICQFHDSDESSRPDKDKGRGNDLGVQGWLGNNSRWMLFLRQILIGFRMDLRG